MCVIVLGSFVSLPSLMCEFLYIIVLGSFAYLNVVNKIENGKAVLNSPVYQNAYSNCIFDFYYYIHGYNVGEIKVKLRMDYTHPTTLFHVKGESSSIELLN